MSPLWRSSGETPAAFLRHVPRPLPGTAPRGHRALPGRLQAPAWLQELCAPLLNSHVGTCDPAEHAAITQPNLVAINSSHREKHLTHMAAKDWAPLREALWRHVREPLLRDHTDAWNGIKPGDTIPFVRRRHLAQDGRISARDEKAAVLWYTLVYGCMHYDALRALMDKQEFKGRVHGALNRPSKHHSRSIPYSFQDNRSNRTTVSSCLLHLDFGCGPGTAAWAVINALSSHTAITTLGHDHNPCMAELAHEITADIIERVDRRIEHEFFSDWNTFEETAKWSRSLTSCDAVLVTVNSLFTQPSVNREEIDNIVRLIKLILMVLKSVERNSPVIAIGTHPDYKPMKDKVVDGWRRIGNISGRRTRYDGNVQFASWSPLCFGDYEPSDEAAWDKWAGSAWQLAHILKVR